MSHIYKQTLRHALTYSICLPYFCAHRIIFAMIDGKNNDTPFVHNVVKDCLCFYFSVMGLLWRRSCFPCVLSFLRYYFSSDKLEITFQITNFRFENAAFGRHRNYNKKFSCKWFVAYIILLQKIPFPWYKWHV